MKVQKLDNTCEQVMNFNRKSRHGKQIVEKNSIRNEEFFQCA